MFQEKCQENRVLNQGKISHFFQKMILSQKESKFFKILKTAKSAKLVKVRAFWTFAVSTKEILESFLFGMYLGSFTLPL